ncbi:hypothetical protein [Paraclostridium bifermentans]|uniref:hypothetical protein n=1 Tax=Paraclostridium bifermentans TaxID=1490 RepID=UPI00359C95DD
MKKIIIGALGLGILVTGFSSISYANENKSLDNYNNYSIQRLDSQNEEPRNDGYRGNYNDCCYGNRGYDNQSNRINENNVNYEATSL